jgi:hypothetical protein
VYGKLKKIENAYVFLKEDIPDELHIKNNVRTGDILIIAKLGFTLYADKARIFTPGKTNITVT